MERGVCDKLLKLNIANMDMNVILSESFCSPYSLAFVA